VRRDLKRIEDADKARRKRAAKQGTRQARVSPEGVGDRLVMKWMGEDIVTLEDEKKAIADRSLRELRAWVTRHSQSSLHGSGA
jgi:hypothetical protein